MQALLKIALIIISFLLSSCIDGEEEITIQSNGSGTVECKYRIPQQALSQKDATALKNFLTNIQERHPSLHLKKFEIKTEPSRLFGPKMQNISIQIDFDSVIKLPEIYQTEIDRLKAPKEGKKPNPELIALVAKSKAILGTIDVEMNGLDVNFNRTIDLEPLFEGRLKNGNIFGNSTFRYIVNLPTPAGVNNATTVTNDRKTLQWTINLKESFGKPIRMKSEIPIPMWLKVIVISSSLIILITLILIINFIVRKRRKKNPKPTYEPSGL